MRTTIAILLCVLATIAAAQTPSTDSLINHTLGIVDMHPFEWEGKPDPMKPRLGFYMNYVPADSVKIMTNGAESLRGNRVWHVMPHWSADEAGLLIGDIVLYANGKTLEDSVYGPDDILNSRVSEMHPGDIVTLRVIRDNKLMDITVPLFAATRTPMNFMEPPRLGTIRENTWLKQTIAQNSMEEWVKNIQRQMRIVADQDYCTVPFAGRPNPWRLNAVTYLHHNPTRIGVYSRMVDQDLWDGLAAEHGVAGALTAAAHHLDLPASSMTMPPTPMTKDAMDAYMGSVQRLLDKGYGPVKSDIESLARGLAGLLDMDANWENEIDSAKTPLEKRSARGIVEKRLSAWLGAADKVDLPSIVDAARMLGVLADTNWLRSFAAALTAGAKPMTASVEGVDGPVLLAWQTPEGRCVVGGSGSNKYTGSFRLIIDIGGDDVYDLPPVPPGTFRFIGDLSGNDFYTGAASGGSGVGAVDVLVDCAGNDTYRGKRWSQGAGCLGVGVLADFGGDDIYTANWCSQGAGFLGIGLLYEVSGTDNYSSEAYSQGFAYAKGFGTIMEQAGNDQYRAGWKIEDSRWPNRAHLSMSQGFGYGMRPWTTGVGTDGGIGVLSDKQGDDVYESDLFSQGGSYWYALGILHDWQGADRYIAGQYSQGSGIHLSFAALLDDSGDDMYDAYAGLEQGNAHDWSAGCLEDFSGNDTYRGYGSSQGSALTVAFAYLLDSHGDDAYYCKLSDTTLSQGGGSKTPVRKAGSLGLLMDLGHGDDYFVEKRVTPGVAVLKGNRGFIYDDGVPEKK